MVQGSLSYCSSNFCSDSIPVWPSTSMTSNPVVQMPTLWSGNFLAHFSILAGFLVA